MEDCPTKDGLYRKNWPSKVCRAKEVSESCIALILISSSVGHGNLNGEGAINDMIFCQQRISFHFERER